FMLQAMDSLPVNIALLGKGNTVSPEALHEQLAAGASGFKLHEDWGTTPAAIDACLQVCDETGAQVAIHTDTLNEAGYVESTLAAEDVLHDLGAISMIGSDSQAMGRIGEVVLRTWQTAHVMKRRRGALAGDGPADNHRARRYVAKYTICPAVAHGLDDEVGSVAVGTLAALV